MLAAAGANGLGALGLDLWSGHVGPSLVSRGRRHVRVGAVALGNLVFRVVCICIWALGLASFMFFLSRVFVRSWSASARSAGRFARSCGFRSLGSRVFRMFVLAGAVSCTSCSRAGP